MITCIKIAAYELRPSKGSVFQYLRKVGLQKINPPSLLPESIHPSSNIVFSSPLRRATESLKLTVGQKLIETSLLREIPFDILDFCNEEEYVSQKSVAVRRGFKEHFINNNLPIPREELVAEIENILIQARAINENVTIVSHSFRLKFLEAYVKTQGRLKNQPELINDYILDYQKTFDFGQGFNISKAQLAALKIK